MRDAYDSGSLFPVLLIAFGFLVVKLLAAIGIARRHNINAISKVMGGACGIWAAIGLEVVRSLGPVLDLVVRLGLGVIVAVVFWIFFLIGAGGAVKDD